MSMTEVHDYAYDFLLDGYYIHLCHDADYDYSSEEVEEHSRKLKFPLASPMPCGLTRGGMWLLKCKCVLS